MTSDPTPPGRAQKPPSQRKFPCPACGAKLDFDPCVQALHCPYCGHLEKIEAKSDATIEEHDFDTFLERVEKEKTTIAGRSSEIRCTGCGAIILLEDKVATDKCPFCTTHLENAPEAAAEMIPPESLLPFKIDAAAARQAFNKWITGLWFAPNELKDLANLGQISGVYLPFWTYDSMTLTHYSGQRGDDYQVQETYTDRDAQGNLVTRTRSVTHTRWLPVSGEVEHFFDDVLICATKSLPREKVDALEPWDLPDLTPFKPDYLSGFKTERYGIDLNEGFACAREVMDRTIRELCMADIGGDHQMLAQVDTRHRGVTFKHLLLPLWLAAYRYRDKLFQILVNARTGEVVGDRPFSVWKIVGAIAAAILAMALIVGGIVAMKHGGIRFGNVQPRGVGRFTEVRMLDDGPRAAPPTSMYALNA
ncbi:MAG: hypothetical protein ACJ8C4_18770 [Gemmataceae bacterium]